MKVSARENWSVLPLRMFYSFIVSPVRYQALDCFTFLKEEKTMIFQFQNISEGNGKLNFQLDKLINIEQISVAEAYLILIILSGYKIISKIMDN